MTEDASPATGSSQDDFDAVVEQLRAWVEFAATTGIDGFAAASTAEAAPGSRRGTAAGAEVASRTPIAPGPGARQASRPPEPVPPPADENFAPEPPAMPAAPDVDLAAVADLAGLRAALGDCSRCKLCSGRTNIVFGVGNPTAALMFVGEGPGRDEDLKAEPFVGRAGQLLTDIITKGMKLRREDVYIANVVKCRPPHNRDPEPDEIAACRPFLQRQIELVQPKVLVALGRFAAQTMLGTNTPISRLRGRWHEYAGIKLMPTLHPAYLLRNPADKRLVWEDIQMVMAELGLER